MRECGQFDARAVVDCAASGDGHPRGYWRGTRAALLRQLLTESMLIALAGGIGGSIVAVGGVKLLVALLPADFPRAHAIHLNLTVFAFTFAIASRRRAAFFGFAPCRFRLRA